MFAALPIALGLAGTLALSDRTEMRVRMPGSDNKAASLDLENRPEARLMLASRRMQYAFGYRPTGTLWDVGSRDFRGTLQHEGSAGVTWLLPRARLSLDETASYGSMDFSSAAITPGPNGQPPRVDVIPAPQVVRYGSSRTTLASRLTLDRWALDSAVGYQLSGGVTAAARTVMPFQKGGFGHFRGEYTVTRQDFAATTFTASESRFSSGPEAVLTRLDERWRHLLSRVTTSELTLGASLARVRTSPTTTFRLETHPVALGTLEHRMAARIGRLDLRAEVGVAPVVNQLVGSVDERLQGTFMGTHTYKRFSTHALVSASESISTSRDGAARFLAGGIGTTYTPRGIVAYDAGVRAFWQHEEATGADFFQGTLFIGITFHTDPIHF